MPAVKVNRQMLSRPFVQFGGARPNNRPLFYGSDTNYLAVGSPSNPVRGGVEPIWTAAADGALTDFDLIGRSISAPDLPSVDVVFREKIGAIPRHYLALNCLMNLYVARGECKTLSDLANGWESYVKIFSGGLVTDVSTSEETAFDSDEPIETTVSLVLSKIYAAGSLGFAEKIASTITLEITDVVYASRTLCGECGPSNDGTNWIYAVEKGGAAAKPIVYYSTDAGATWASVSIDTAANAETIAALRVMGNYLIAVSPTASSATQGGYYYTTINRLTGAPGSSWTKVTSGFSNNQEPRDMVVLGPREAYLCTDGGEILRITDVPTGAVSLGIVTSNDLARIHADAASNVIVAVGASATVVKSVNRGASFAATTTNPGAAALTAIHVLDQNRFWVGNSSGAAYYTLNGGETWTAQTFAAGVSPSAVQDIRFPTDECGYIVYTASSLGRMAATIDGGNAWVRSDLTNPRVFGINPAGTSQRYNRIAIPLVNDASVAANNVVIGGLGATTDGALMIAAANVF